MEQVSYPIELGGYSGSSHATIVPVDTFCFPGSRTEWFTLSDQCIKNFLLRHFLGGLAFGS